MHDTVDLRAGPCGGTREQIAAVPLSRFEASGISGDVPFIVAFPAPAADLMPKTIPQLPGAGPQHAIARRAPAATPAEE